MHGPLEANEGEQADSHRSELAAKMQMRATVVACLANNSSITPKVAQCAYIGYRSASLRTSYRSATLRTSKPNHSHSFLLAPSTNRFL